jgi:hypothetical protein
MHRSRDPVLENGWRHRRGPMTRFVRPQTPGAATLLASVDQHLQPIAIDLLPRMGEAEMADLLKAAGHDVLEEPPDELLGGDRHGPPAAAAALAVAEGDAAQAAGARFAADQPPVADRDPVDIRGRVKPAVASQASATHQLKLVANREPIEVG